MRTLDELGISKTPWKTEDGLIMGIRILTGVTDGNGELVAIERNKSDARLIESAPSLYEALQFINEHISFSAFGGGADVVADAKRMMIDALAAASGEKDEGEDEKKEKLK